jgi:hypothetical protein
LDLSKYKLSSLDLSLHSNRATLRFGSGVDSVNATVAGKTGELNLIIPDSFGLAITGSRVNLDGIMAGTGLHQNGNGYYSDGFAASQRKIEITLSADVKTLTISHR